MNKKDKRKIVEEVIWAMRANLITANNFMPSENLNLKTIYRKGEFDGNDGEPTYKSMGVEDIAEFLMERFDIPDRKTRVVVKPQGEDPVVMCDWSYDYDKVEELYEELVKLNPFSAVYIEEEKDE